MPFELGNAFAVIGLDTAPMKAGAGVVGGIVDEINSHLSRIGDIAAGVALGETIGALVRDIESIPRALFDVEQDFERFHAGLTGLFEAMAQQIPPTYEQMMAAIASSTEQTRGKVTRSLEDMADAVAQHDRSVTQASTQRDNALQNEQASLQNNAERLQQATETFQNKLSDYGTTFDDTIARITQSFNQGMQALEISHTDAIGRIESQIGQLAITYADKVESIKDHAAEQFAAAAEKHAQAMAQIDKQLRDEDQKFDDAGAKRTRALEEATETATRSYSKAMQQANDDTVRIFQESAQAISQINQKLAEQLSAIRADQLDLQRSFSEKMEDLTLKGQGSLTSQQQSDLARERNRLVADNSAREAALANREKQAQATATTGVEKAQQDEQKKLAAVTKRMTEEQQKYDDQLVKIAEHYDQETALAERSHDERLADLATKQAQELEQYRGHLAGIAAAEQQQLDTAKGAYDDKLQQLAAAFSKEDGMYALHTQQLRDRTDLETQRAQDQYDKQVRTAQLSYQHDVDNFNRSRADIEQRYAQTVVRQNQEDANREAAFATRLRHMEERQAEFNKKIEADTSQLTDKYERIGKTGAELFSAPWIAKANELEQKFSNAFTWHIPDQALSQQAQVADRIEQIDEFLLIMDQRTGVALPKLRQGFFELLAGGVDPVKDGVLNIVATLAALPQGRGNIDAISRAFIELSEGGFGRAQRELRQFGIDLATITTTNGTFILNEQHRLNVAQGVTQQQAWDAIVRTVKVSTDAIALNLQGTALQLITTLQTMWISFEQIAGKQLFESTKKAMSDFITFLRANKELVQDVATTLGTTLGNMADTIFSALKRLGEADALKSIGDFLAALGHLKDSILEVVGDIADAFLGGGRSADIFTNLTRFGNVIEGIAQQLSESGPDIASRVKEIADAVGQFVHNVLEFLSDHGDELKATIGDVFYAITFGIRSVVEYFSTHEAEVKIIQDWFGETIVSVAKFIDAMAKFNIAAQDFITTNTPFIEFLGKLTIFGNADWVSGTANFFQMLIGWLGKAMEALGVVKDTLGRIKDTLGDVYNAFNDFYEKVADIFDAKSIGKLLSSWKDGLMDFADNFIRNWGNAVANAFSAAFRVIAAATTLGMSELPTIIKGVLDHIYGHSIIEDWLASLETGFPAGMQGVIGGVGDAFAALVPKIQTTLDGLQQQFDTTLAGLNSLALGYDRVRTPAPGTRSPVESAPPSGADEESSAPPPITTKRQALEFYASPAYQAATTDQSVPGLSHAFDYLDYVDRVTNAYGAPPGVPTQRYLESLAYRTPAYGTPPYVTPTGTYGGATSGGATSRGGAAAFGGGITSPAGGAVAFGGGVASPVGGGTAFTGGTAPAGGGIIDRILAAQGLTPRGAFPTNTPTGLGSDGSSASGASYWDTPAGKAFIAQYKVGYDQTAAGRAQAEGRALLADFDAREKAAWDASWAPPSAAQVAAQRAVEDAHAKQIDAQFGGIRDSARTPATGTPGLPGLPGLPGIPPLNAPQTGQLNEAQQLGEQQRQQQRDQERTLPKVPTTQDQIALAQAIAEAIAERVNVAPQQFFQGANITNIETEIAAMAYAAAELARRVRTRT